MGKTTRSNTPRPPSRMASRRMASQGIRSLRRIQSRRVGRFKKLVKPLAGPAETGFRHFMAGLTTLKKGQVSGPASHAGEEIYLVLEGVGLAQLGRQRRRVVGESVIAISPHVLHRLEAVSHVLRYVWVLAPPQEESMKNLAESRKSRQARVRRLRLAALDRARHTNHAERPRPAGQQRSQHRAGYPHTADRLASAVRAVR